MNLNNFQVKVLKLYTAIFSISLLTYVEPPVVGLACEMRVGFVSTMHTGCCRPQ